MIKRIYVSALPAIMFILASCTSGGELPEGNDRVGETEQKEISLTLTPEEATRNVFEFIAEFEGGDKLRSTAKQVMSVSPISSTLQTEDNLRSGETNLTDTTLYLLNFTKQETRALYKKDTTT